MPKKKTNKAAAKRFRLTSKGKLKFARPGSGHLLSSKSKKRKRNLRRSAILAPAHHRRITELLQS